MKGHIVKRSKTSYSLVIELGPHPETGKRQQKWITVEGTKKEAEKELAKRLNEVNTGNFVEPDKVSVADYFDQWLTVAAPLKAGQLTIDRYKGIIDHHIKPSFGRLRLQSLTPMHIETHYSRLRKGGRKDGREGGLSPQTILHHHRLISEALQKAVSWGLLQANPADRVEAPSVPAREVEPINEAESAWLLTVAEGTRLYIPILMAVSLGLRRGEILAVQWRDLDAVQGVLRIRRAIEESSTGMAFKTPKSKSGNRKVAVPRVTLVALEKHRAAQERNRELLGEGYAANDLICCVEDGTVWKPSAFTSAYRDLLRRRKLTGPNFHALRHTHASHLLDAGVDAKVISKRLGHSRASFTMDIYAHLMPGQDEEAAARLDKRLQSALDKTNANRA